MTDHPFRLRPPDRLSAAVRAVLGLPRRSGPLLVAGLLGLPASVPAFPANSNLADLDGTNGFKLNRRLLWLPLIALVATMAVATSVLAAPGDITLASTSDTGVKGNGRTDFVSRPSADGTKVAFSAQATNLDPANTESGRHVYVKDLVSGDITLASTSDTGVQGNGDSLALSLSAGGTRVAFESFATNLDPADIDDNLSDVYVKDLVSGDITLASTSDTTTVP